jgi:hypothetical protein
VTHGRIKAMRFRQASICNLGGARAERKHESHPAAICIVLSAKFVAIKYQFGGMDSVGVVR